jgi:uncharacterized membrane protein YcaP (DUF421 family)
MEIVLRAATVYLLILVTTKAMGRRELSQMSSFELLLLVIMGDLIQQAVTQEDRSITGGLIAVSTLSLMIVGISWLTFHSKKARDVLEGVPVVVIRGGEILVDSLRHERVTVDEMQDAAREQGISDLSKVEIGVLEADGRFSFLLKEKGGRQQRTNQPEQIV